MNTKIVAVTDPGYIGFPMAVVLTEAGYCILGVDTSPSHAQAVNAGQVPFLEPGLGEALQEVHATRLITASEQATLTDVHIVSVPTPFQGDHHMDLSFVTAAADEISPYVSKDALMILESTSSPDTIEAMSEHIEHNHPDPAGSPLFAYYSERVLPGKIMVEVLTNDRIVGGLTPEAARAAQEFYTSFCRGQIRLTDAKTVELLKLAGNSFRDMNIVFADGLAKICDYLGIGV